MVKDRVNKQKVICYFTWSIVILIVSSVGVNAWVNNCYDSVDEIRANIDRLQYNAMIGLTDVTVQFSERNYYTLTKNFDEAEKKEDSGLNMVAYYSNLTIHIDDLRDGERKESAKCRSMRIWPEFLNALAIAFILLHSIILSKK